MPPDLISVVVLVLVLVLSLELLLLPLPLPLPQLLLAMAGRDALALSQSLSEMPLAVETVAGASQHGAGDARRGEPSAAAEESGSGHDTPALITAPREAELLAVAG